MINTDKALTAEDVYDITQDYINRYYTQTNSDDAAILAGDMMLLIDHTPVDPAMQEDWLKAINLVKPHQAIDINTTKFTIDEAYFAMVKFLEIYCSMGAENDFRIFTESARKKGPKALQDWLDSVKKVTSHTPRIRPYLELLPK